MIVSRQITTRYSLSIENNSRIGGFLTCIYQSFRHIVRQGSVFLIQSINIPILIHNPGYNIRICLFGSHRYDMVQKGRFHFQNNNSRFTWIVQRMNISGDEQGIFFSIKDGIFSNEPDCFCILCTKFLLKHSIFNVKSIYITIGSGIYVSFIIHITIVLNRIQIQI